MTLLWVGGWVDRYPLSVLCMLWDPYIACMPLTQPEDGDCNAHWRHNVTTWTGSKWTLKAHVTDQTSESSSDDIFIHVNKGSVWDLRFSSWCSLGFKSSGTMVCGSWHIKDCSNSEMSETIHPMTSSHLQNQNISQRICCFGVDGHSHSGRGSN